MSQNHLRMLQQARRARDGSPSHALAFLDTKDGRKVRDDASFSILGSFGPVSIYRRRHLTVAVSFPPHPSHTHLSTRPSPSLPTPPQSSTDNYSLVIDLSSILPTFLVTDLSRNLVAYHLERFQDQFFTAPPAWFTVYMWLEVVYHVPISLWLGWGLWNGEFLGSLIYSLLFCEGLFVVGR